MGTRCGLSQDDDPCLCRDVRRHRVEVAGINSSAPVSRFRCIPTRIIDGQLLWTVSYSIVGFAARY